jgi:hypothetical protein
MNALPIPRKLKVALHADLEQAVKALEQATSEMTVGERYSNAGQLLLDSLEDARKALSALDATPVIEELQ